MIRFAPLAPADPDAVEALLDAAFGPDRLTRTAYRLREGSRPLPHLSFAAIDAESLVATLQTWPIEVAPADGPPAPLLLVGPVAVRPERQREGIGRRLMTHALAAMDSAGESASALIGDPDYYGRLFGFSAELTQGWELAGPFDRHRLLARVTGGASLPTEGILRARR